MSTQPINVNLHRTSRWLPESSGLNPLLATNVSLHRTRDHVKLRNPTNGSWWMVQPPYKRTIAVKGELSSMVLLMRTNRLDLKHPPTSVGGIRKFIRPSL